MSLSSDSHQPAVNACPVCAQLVDVSDQEPFDKIGCPHCGDAIRVRTVFDHFHLIEQIGQGGMSRVFRARDSLLHRDVALKILSHECGSDSERLVQFEREARITASFSHPNVVKVYSVGKDQGYFYIAMELVSYSSFEDVITRRGRVSESEVLNIGLAVTQGLMAAQGAGLIHRDIKPGNILFAEDGTAKLVDFGLAIVVERDADESGEIWATPYYVAPEKLTGGIEDFRSDLYSLGATLYHALAGVPPVEASTTSIEELRRLKEKPVDIREASQEISTPTADVINRMLAHDPSDRFDSYEHLASALQAAKQGKVLSSTSARRFTRKRLLIGGLLVAFGLIGIGGYLVFNQFSEKGSEPLVLDETTSGAGSSSRSFLEARRLMLSGDEAEAAKLFAQVASDPKTQQPTLNWALFNWGLASLLQFDQESAHRAFAYIVERGVYSSRREDLELVSFFLDVSKLVPSREPVRSEHVQSFNKEGYRSVGLLALGVSRWGMGDVKQGSELLREFRKRASQPGTSAWVTSYAPLVDVFLADVELLEAVPAPPEEGAPEEVTELKAYIAAAEVAESKLKISDAPPSERLRSQLVQARKRLVALEAGGAAEQVKLNKRNVEKDFNQLKKQLSELSLSGGPTEWKEQANKLKALELRTKSGRAEQRAWVMILNEAASYLEDLGQLDLPTGYSGPVVLKVGAPIYGESIRVDEDGLRIGEGNRRVKFQDCSPSYLVSLGELALEDLRNSDDVLDLTARLAAFAKVNGLIATIPHHLDLLIAVETSEADPVALAMVRILRRPALP